MPRGYNVIDDISRDRHDIRRFNKLERSHQRPPRSYNKDKLSKSGKIEEYRLPEITSTKEYRKFVEKNNKCIIFYGASWCQACNNINDLYSRIAKRYNNRIAFAHVDVDVAKLEFESLPVFTYVKDGKEIDSLEIGDRDMLKEFTKKSISAN